MTSPRSLGALLSAIRPNQDTSGKVSVQDMLAEVGDRSYAPLVLLITVLLITPVSGIPGVPTIGACLIVLITAQWLVGRKHLWLPEFLLRRSISAERLTKGIDWFKPAADWVDGHARKRFRVLTIPPMVLVTKLVIIGVAVTWPVLEILPMVTSIGALALSLLAFGLMVRDGLWLAAGYATIGASAGLVIWLLGQV